jgi:hypothetical protein
MSRFSLGLALVLAAAGPAAAGTMLYATAATTAGVTGYCLGPNGAIMPDPIVNVQTQGGSPSRLITSPDRRFLYVAESNQTEVWNIGPNGFLTRAGQIPDRPPGRVGLKGINSHDIAIGTSTTPDGQQHVVLYQPQRKKNRLAAFPLNPATGLSTGTPEAGTTCVRQTAPAGSAGWENLIVANGLVYASRSHAAGNGLGSGDVAVYKLASNGDFDLPPAYDVNGNQIPAVDTKGAPVTSTVGCPTDLVPYSQRQRLNGAAPMILLDGIIYVGQRFRRTISAYQLCPNQFSSDPEFCPTGGFFRQQKFKKDGQPQVDSNNTNLPVFKYRQMNLSRTHNDIRYNALALAGRTIIGAQFQKGRIDAFNLNDDGTLPSGATRTTKADVRTSPFRMFVSNGVLYVGAGSSDNVQAYRLDANGLPESNGTPFAETNTLRNTFPNDVIVVDISGSCD